MNEPLFKAGDRVRMSHVGEIHCLGAGLARKWGARPVTGVVASTSRHHGTVRVRVDGLREARSYHASFWEKE